MPGLDELKSLHTALVDARHGYEEAIKDAETPELKALFQRMHDQHGRAHADVHRLLEGMGERPDEAGSFMSTVHEAVIGVRSAVVGLGKASLSSFASGEAHTIAHYDDAIRAMAGASGAEALTRDRDELRGMVDEMKRKADA